jgi:pimeloyl-ACP methyl ester carboxylesterase
LIFRVRSSDAVELEVAECGDRAAPTIVLIHGYPDTKEMWSPVRRRLEGRFHLICYDVRGSGGSDRPRGLRAYDLARLGDDLAAVTDRVAAGRRVHLVGHDWGAIQGWEFATSARFQGRLASFTSIAGPSLDQVALSAAELLSRGAVLAWVRRAWRSWYILALLTPGAPTLLWRGLLGAGRSRRLLASSEGLPPEAAYPRPTLVQDAIKGANLYRRNIPRRLLCPRRDAHAHVPVQLIVPTDDPYISPAYYERAARHADSLRRRTVAGGHWLPRTAPDRIAELIAEFVSEIEAGGAGAEP